MKETIIKFEKENCLPCNAVGEFLDQNGINYQRVNPFDNPEMAKAYRVKSVPTVVLLEDGTEIKRSVGYNPIELKNMLKLDASE